MTLTFAYGYDMDSNSSCTYKDLVSDYADTMDHDLWDVVHIDKSTESRNYMRDRMPVALVDTTYEVPSFIPIPILGPNDLEEMLMEPLLTLSEDCVNPLDLVFMSNADPILVAASTYGIKYLAYTLTGCLLCHGEGKSDIYIPQRFMRKIVYDCRSKNVMVNFSHSKQRYVYHRITIPHELKDVCRSITSTAMKQYVTEVITPAYNHGHKYYHPVNVSVMVYLVPNRRIESPGGSGDVVVIKDKRTIDVVPLAVYEPGMATPLRNTHQNGYDFNPLQERSS